MPSPAPRKLLSFLAAVLLAAVLPAAAQPVTWAPRTDLDARLPASVRVFASTGAGLRAYYVAAAPGDTAWTMRAVLSDDADGVETVDAFAEATDALVAVNGGYFGSGQSFSLVAEGGVVRTPNIGALTRDGQTFYPARGAFAVLADGTPDVAWVYDVGGTTYAYPRPTDNAPGRPQPRPTAGFPAGGAPWPLGTGIGGGPVLVQDGDVAITWEEEVFFGSGVDRGVRRARTAVGFRADGTLLLLTIAEGGGSLGATLEETAELLVALGAVEAVNLDGGGSTGLVVAGTSLVATGRQVASALLLAPAPEPPPPPVESVIYDTGDACCYREAGDWFESANTPYHGATPARLNEAGTGADRAVFVLDGLTPGVYDLDAWWVPSSNRAVDTPYTVHHGGDATTVRVDQSDPTTLGRWNPLGTFRLAPGDSVVVTDDASGTASPAYATVDALRLTLRTVTAAERPGTPDAFACSVFPNPTAGPATVAFARSRPAPVHVRVVDLLGRVVFDRTSAPGAASVVLPLGGLPAGLYIVEGRSAERVCRSTVTRVR